MEEEKKQIIFRLKMIDLYRKFSLKKSDSGVFRGQFPILKYISMNDGCSQISMSKEFNISAAAITKTINRLAKAKLIKKKEDKTNKRANLIYITEEGKKALESADVHFKMLDDKSFKDFKDEEIIELKRLLDKMLMNLCEQKEVDDEKICKAMQNLFKEEDK
ncbi:MAG: MarR family transcriptional regulator [Erysipelotrichales bacterium]|nr:MarR family transcriptional regulator [Erysipelotrichales bacterium]